MGDVCAELLREVAHVYSLADAIVSPPEARMVPAVVGELEDFLFKLGRYAQAMVEVPGALVIDEVVT